MHLKNDEMCQFYQINLKKTLVPYESTSPNMLEESLHYVVTCWSLLNMELLSHKYSVYFASFLTLQNDVRVYPLYNSLRSEIKKINFIYFLFNVSQVFSDSRGHSIPDRFLPKIIFQKIYLIKYKHTEDLIKCHFN